MHETTSLVSVRCRLEEYKRFGQATSTRTSTSQTRRGCTWEKGRTVTAGSAFNHSYVRRPRHAHDPFFAFWADGDLSAESPSRLYFSDSTGSRCWRLAYDMLAIAPDPSGAQR